MFPDRFKVINAGDGARGVDGCIVQLVPNVREEGKHFNGLLRSDLGTVVQIIEANPEGYHCKVGQYWRISNNATYEEI